MQSRGLGISPFSFFLHRDCYQMIKKERKKERKNERKKERRKEGKKD